ncbi:MAG: hypothetical protein COX82_04840 [Candidatus Magasanikbacteria bacterium CG_4_10_14_0_2_um_filter_41_10]|uniref:Cohesin domain-containing protein n=1 Tax=Candidatus Magasanikbacteria bacterium CG_4_10_14_0_2_um_filter_41_10 TaxID=1974638 RepID=A0A2M7V285_9BACT|nr:MAG: hypothetical protein COX82_04840 [Candidatus Magasanikbacteria bacterium CG_4_10_14_0_2_um_filter_41_10]
MFIALSWCWAPPVFAADIFVEAENSHINLANTFEVNFFLDTQGVDINALEGNVVFPEQLIAVKDIKDGNSLVNFWVERPHVTNGTVPFSGIIPGGFESKRGLMFSIIFQPKQTGTGDITVHDMQVLLNDGNGTAASTTVQQFNITISREAPTSQPLETQQRDTVPPEQFEPVVTSDSSLFDGKYTLVFATQDKGTGIDHYEIKESREFHLWKWTFAEPGKWVIAENPYVLQDQELKSYIYIKAIDKNGNERIVTLEPLHTMKWYEIWWIWSIIGVSMFILFIGTKILWRKKTISKV